MNFVIFLTIFFFFFFILCICCRLTFSIFLILQVAKMAEGETGWEDMINESLVGEKRCFVGGVGDATNGYLLGHVFWSKDEENLTDQEKEDRDKWKYLYSGETYTVDVLADDLVTTNQIEVCEPTALKEAIDSDVPTQGLYIGGKKYRAVQVQSFPAKSYPDSNVKAIVIALDKIAGCIATDGGYYVIGLIDTKEVEQKNLAVELACDMAAYLTQISG